MWEIESFLLTTSSLFSLSCTTTSYFDLGYLFNANYMPSPTPGSRRQCPLMLYTHFPVHMHKSQTQPYYIRIDYMNSHTRYILIIPEGSGVTQEFP